MRLQLQSIECGGIYGSPPRLPARMRWLHPGAAEAAEALQREYGPLVLSDCWRSAEQSLQAAQEKRGVQPPAYSGHNFGVAIDVAVDAQLRVWGVTYPVLLARLSLYGWHCHRRDARRGFEDWHFNHLPGGPGRVDSLIPSTWAAPVEARIQELYGPELRPSAAEAQAMLVRLGLYHGEVDGQLGPRSRQAIGAFQRAWRVPGVGRLDPRTARVLAFVTTEFDRKGKST